MEIDLRNPEGPLKALATLDANAMNVFVSYCKSLGLDPKSVKVIHYGDGGGDVNVRISRAAQISERFGIVVHLSHYAIPITCHPTVRDAAFADYQATKARHQQQRVESDEGA